MLIFITVGSISAADSDLAFDDVDGEDEYIDEDLDDGTDFDDDLNDDSDFEDDSDWDDDSDFDDDGDLDDGSDFDDEDIDDLNISDDYFTSYEYLKFKTISYLDRFGNCSDENWTQSEEFLSEYQIYLKDPSNYTLNESSKGYETYLKIFNSITSTFGDYNLSDNETEYLKFMIIYYLNHYGNVSENYTWNESDEFYSYVPWFCLTSAISGSASDSDIIEFLYPVYKNSNILSDSLTSVSLDNSNATSNASCLNTTSTENYGWLGNIFILLLMVILVILIII